MYNNNFHSIELYRLKMVNNCYSDVGFTRIEILTFFHRSFIFEITIIKVFCNRSSLMILLTDNFIKVWCSIKVYTRAFESGNVDHIFASDNM